MADDPKSLPILLLPIVCRRELSSSRAPSGRTRPFDPEVLAGDCYPAREDIRCSEHTIGSSPRILEQQICHPLDIVREALTRGRRHLPAFISESRSSEVHLVRPIVDFRVVEAENL